MKKMKITAAVVCLALTLKVNAQTIKGRLVYASCANSVIEILDEPYFAYSQKEWQKDGTDKVYNNVFRVTNNCKFFAENLKVGQVFTFNVLPDPQENNGCVQCTIYELGPRARLSIEVVKPATAQ